MVRLKSWLQTQLVFLLRKVVFGKLARFLSGMTAAGWKEGVISQKIHTGIGVNC